MAIPNQCPNTEGLNLNSNPSLSSFPCDVLKAVGIDNVNPIFQTPKPFDYSIYTNHLERLSSVGDPRWSLGAMFTDLLDNIIPQVVVQTEIQQAGGCQIIDQFICDADGKPLKSTTSTCVSAFSGVPLTVTPEFLRTYILSKMEDAKTKAADRFIAYLQNNYTQAGWNLSGVYHPDHQIFYIQATRPQSVTAYFKYFPDQQSYLVSKLGISIQTAKDISIAAGTYNTAIKAMLIAPIANY